MIVDTSVWIEYLRTGESAAGDHLEQMIGRGDRIIVPENVVLEPVPNEPFVDSLRAAALQRECRRGGETVRNLGDCLVAAVALRLGETVLHRDRDFEVLAARCGLPTVSLL